MINRIELKEDINIKVGEVEFNFNSYSNNGTQLWCVDGKDVATQEYTLYIDINKEDYANSIECYVKYGKNCGTSNYSFDFTLEGEDGYEYKVEINPYNNFPTAVTFYDWNEDDECWEYPKYHNDDEDCLLEDNSEILEGAYNFITDNLETIYAVIDNTVKIIDKLELMGN